MAKLTIDEVRAILEAEQGDALDAEQSSKLSEERSKALDFYLGDMTDHLPSLPDRSGAISTDVADTVEGLLPQLMEIFAGGEEVVRFDPVGPEDEPAAEQETDYVNHVFMQRNAGWSILYTFIKDALLSKVGVVKVWWETTEREERETYRGLDDDAYAVLMADGEVEVVEHTEEAVEVIGPDGMPVAVTSHDVTVLKRTEIGKCCVENVPPEEFGITRRARYIHDADYAYHRVYRTESQLIEMGYDADQVRDLGSSDNWDTEEDIARDTVEDSDIASRQSLNKANRPIEVTEHYCKMDYDGDKARLYRVATAGKGREILRRDGEPDIEPVDMIPFAAMTPIPLPHRFFGRSIADLVTDIQMIKTSLLRSLLDNAYLANNQRIEIAETHAGAFTLDDLLNNRPGGIIRTRQPGGLMPVPNQSIGDFAYPLLEYADMTREWRTGVTRQTQGIDSEALQNQSATAVAQVYSAAQARVLLIARIFAETGIRDLFSLIHACIRKYDSKAATVRLRNKWVQVDPRAWRRRDDMTINVGLGHGTKHQQVAFLLQLLGIQREAIVSGSVLASEDKIYNTLDKLVQLGGLNNVETFFNDPRTTPPRQPAPDPKMIEIQGKLQLAQAEAQLDRQAAAEKAKLDYAAEETKAQRQAMIEDRQAEADIAVKQQEMQASLQLAAANFEFQKELELLKLWVKTQQDAKGGTIDFETLAGMVQTNGGGKVTPAMIDAARLTPVQDVEQAVKALADELGQNREATTQQLMALVEHMNAPRRVIRGDDGRVAGVQAGERFQPVLRDETGRVVGLDTETIN